jgi:hypothetical protein
MTSHSYGKKRISTKVRCISHCLRLLSLNLFALVSQSHQQEQILSAQSTHTSFNTMSGKRPSDTDDSSPDTTKLKMETGEDFPFRQAITTEIASQRRLLTVELANESPSFSHMARPLPMFLPANSRKS